MCVVASVPIERNPGSSGDCEGHGMSTNRGITRWKRLRTSSVPCRPVCALLPSSWKQTLLERLASAANCETRSSAAYVTSDSNCNSSAAFLTPNCYSYVAAELLQLMQKTVTVDAENRYRLLQNCYSCCRKLLQLLQKIVTVAAEL
jgi:hypothetical protein